MFANLFTIENLTIFLVLTALETVLGFDNLLYISIEAKRVAAERQSFVRRWGILLAIGLRIVLLFVVLQLIQAFQDPLFEVNFPPFIEGQVSGHALIVLIGGVFLMYTAMKEILHMMSLEEHDAEQDRKAGKSIASALFWILAMNLVFSFDTVLSAVALTKNFIVMTAAIIVSGALMVLMADAVANFLKRNRMYEVLGLFVLLLVGIMLMSEGGHIAHLHFFGYEVTAMSKATFYFVLVTMVLVEVVQGRYQRKLLAEKEQLLAHKKAAANHG
ncbi:MAG: tellurium resistance protein TerC [Notoacmeibacter sp.]|nr:tellurium resistance protein TerC [Notoacmeibacter sp.]